MAEDEPEEVHYLHLPLSGARIQAGDAQIERALRLHEVLLDRERNLLTHLPDILDRLLDTILEVSQADHVVWVPATGSDPESAEFEIGTRELHDPAGWAVEALRDRSLFWVKHLRKGDGWPGHSGGWHSVAVIPMRVPPAGGEAGDLVFLFYAWSLWPAFWTDERVNLLAVLAEAGPRLLRYARALKNVVFTDSLCPQVWGRKYFERMFPIEFNRAQRDQRLLALCILDIDDFKQYNTKFGYKIGSETIRHVGAILRGSLNRGSDWVCRWGGDEFVLVLYPETFEKAAAFVREIHARIAGSHLHGGVSTTIGGAVIRTDTGTENTLWETAENALTEAKRRGKGRVLFHREIEAPPPPDGSG